MSRGRAPSQLRAELGCIGALRIENETKEKHRGDEREF
jgi:hypothetical protein